MATKKSGNKSSKQPVSRPKPSAPRAGFKKSGSRYGKGGELK